MRARQAREAFSSVLLLELTDRTTSRALRISTQVNLVHLALLVHLTVLVVVVGASVLVGALIGALVFGDLQFAKK